MRVRTALPGAPLVIPLGELVRDVRRGVGETGPSGWLTALVAAYLRRYRAHRAAHPQERDTMVSPRQRAEAIIRRACVRAALSGGASGAVTTGASVATAQTNGMVALLTGPATAVAVIGEVVLRSVIHLEMTCELAEVFALQLDPEDPFDLWALMSLVWGTDEAPRTLAEGGDPATTIARFASAQGHALGKKLGARLVGEGVARNLVPFVDVASSSITNWVLTRKLGDTVRRYARYRRAFDDALAAGDGLAAERDLVMESAWFLFSADGRLSPEEAALLASLLRNTSPGFRAELADRLADDIGWVDRLRTVPEHACDALLHVIEIAATVDTSVTLREEKLLEHAARALGRPYDREHVEKMRRDFAECSVLSPEATHRTAARSRRAS